MKSAAATLFLSLFVSSALARRAQDALPQEEQKLFEHAQKSSSKGLYAEAARAFEAFVEKFPSSESFQAAMTELGSIYQNILHRPADARRRYAALREKFPKSEDRWYWRRCEAECLAAEGKPKEALAEFRTLARESEDPSVRGSAAENYWRIQNKDLRVTVVRTYTAGREPLVHLRRSGISEIRFRAVRIEYSSLLPLLESGSTTDPAGLADRVGKEGRKLLKEWTQKYDAVKAGAVDEDVAIPASESGVYVLEAEAEGVVMSAPAVVSRYGVLTKSAAGKLICFVQERATSRPVPGAEIRVVSDERPFRGTTDGNGLFVTAGFRGGVVVGLKDGEFFSTPSNYGDSDEPDTKVYVATDRPIYRPGDTVRFHVVCRDELLRTLSTKPGRQIRLTIGDPRNNPVYESKLALGDFGTAEATFVLGASPTLGEYHVTATAEDPGQPESDRTSLFWSPAATFRVDEYRKPEFKVLVNYPSPVVLQGDRIRATVRAEYYFGGPVSDARVEYRVLRARLSWWNWAGPYFYDWYSGDATGITEDIYWSPRWFGEAVTSGEGQTDKDGTFPVEIENEKDEHDFVYTVVAKTTDLSRRCVEGFGSCKAPRAEFALALSLNQYVYKAGDRIAVKARAVTHDEKPAAETRVTLKIEERRWNRDQVQDATIYEASSLTDANGLVEFSHAPELAGGCLVITALAKDRRGNVASTEQWVWLWGVGDWYTPRDLEGFTLTADKKVYEIGDTAKVLVQCRDKNVTFLLTLEGSEIYHREVVAMKGRSALVEIKLDHPGLAPNAYLEATAIRGDEIFESAARLVINPARRLVNVAVTPDREEYRPRQKARYEIRTTDADGRPVAAEVSLGIVDDSIYALQEEYAQDIRKFFVHSQENQVITSASISYYSSGGAGRLGGPLTGATFALAEEKSSNGNSFAGTEVRSKFADTMLWKVVRTDAEGRALVEVDVPDNLTAWRATARAVTADSRFGQERRSVLSRKNVLVRLETPRVLTQNDVTTLTAVVHNDLPVEKELRVEFAATGVAVEGGTVSTVRVPAGGRKRLDWKATAKDAGTARVVVKALGDTDSDAMEVTLPVRVHGTPRWESKAGAVEARTVEKVVVPADAVPGTAELVVAVSPVHASMVLDALDSLAGYPYGCVEQTMSKFLPSVIVAGTLKKLGLSRPALEKELPRMIADGLQRLYSMQHDDGGWGWWSYDETNPWMTAYVLSGLTMAREAGVDVSATVLGRALNAARALLGKSEDPNLEAYLLHAITFAGEPGEEEVLWGEYLEAAAAGLKPYAQALLALVDHAAGRDARPILRRLARQLGETGTFEGGRSYGWLDDGAEAAAATLRAFLAIDPKDPVVPRLVHGLAQKRRGPWWTSTRQTATAVYALAEYLAKTGELRPDLTLSLSLNGKAIYAEHVTRENWAAFDGVRKFPAAELKPGENEVVMERRGEGSPTFAISLRYYQKGEDLTASPGGLRIERSYGVVESQGGERVVRPLAKGAVATSGQEIEVTLAFTADRAYEWLMVEDPLPSGFEPVREYWGWWGWEWSYWYSLKEFHDDRVSIGMRYIDPGEHRVTYTMRAETPGDYHVLPAHAFNMYFPEVGGNSGESRIKVEDRK